MTPRASTELKPPRSRLRRWLIGLSLLAMLLGAYAVALHWFGLRLGDGIESSIRTTPTVEDTHHRAPD